MSNTPQEASLEGAIVRFKSAVGLAEDFTKGDASVDVNGIDGSYPSLAKLAAQAQTKLHLLQAVSIHNVSNDDMLLGMAVYSPSNGAGDLANAASDTKKTVIGLVADDLIVSQSGQGSILTTGMLTGTIAQWEAATGLVGGLKPRSNYYLDVVAGRITPYPSGDEGSFICPVGYALTETDFIIRIERIIAI